MSLADDIRANWDAECSRMRKIDIPEWGMAIYVAPLNVQQMGTIAAEENLGRRLARILVSRARDEKGTPLFGEAEFEAFVLNGTGKYGPEVLARVVGEIQSDYVLDVEEAEKN